MQAGARRLFAALRRRARRLLVGLAILVVGLPAALTAFYAVVPPPVTPLMLIRLIEGEGLSRSWEGLPAISEHLRASVLAAEDNRFCAHWGFDFDSLVDAVQGYRDGDSLRGASTVTMQTAKNLYLWPGKNFIRKGLEAYLTVWLEALLSKRRILELYLNVAEWGPGLYGAEAAAQHYFGKPAARLSRREAALMAAVLPNPRRWSPAKPTAYIARRATTLQRRVGQLGPLLDCVRDKGPA